MTVTVITCIDGEYYMYLRNSIQFSLDIGACGIP